MMRLMRWMLWAIPALAACTYTGQFVTLDLAGAQLAVSTPSVVANGHDAAQITLTLQGVNPHAVNGVRVRFALVNGGAFVLSPNDAFTDSTGVASTQLSSLQTGEATVMAYVVTPSGNQEAVDGTVAVHFTEPIPSSTGSVLTVSPSVAPADGVSTVTVTVVARDVYGNAAGFAPVLLTCSGSSNALAAASGTTDAAGNFSTTLASSVAETKTVTATLGGFELANTVTFVAGLPAAGASSITVTPAVDIASVVPNGLVSVLLQDAYGNPVPNEAVSLSAAAANLAFTPIAGYTDSTGVFNANVTAAMPTTTVLYASAGPQFLTSSAVSFFSGSPNATQSSLQVLSNNPTAHGNAAQAVLVLRDYLGFALPGYPLSVSATNTASPPFATSAQTDSLGIAKVTIASVYAGPKVVNASSSDGFALSAAVTFAPSTPFCANAGFFAGQPPMVSNIAAPQMVSTALINGDSYKDLLFATANSNQVGVALGLGNGRFATPTYVSAGGAGPSYVAVCDLTGAGWQDVVVVNQSSGSFSAFLNPNGTLWLKTTVLMGLTGLASAAIACVDVTHDGKPDVIINDSLGSIQVYGGNGDGTFTAHFVTPAVTPMGLAVADVTGDGNADVVYPDGNANVVLMAGNGTGSFPTVSYYPVNGGPVYVGLANLNQDSNLDMAAVTTGGRLVTFINNGAGTFSLSANVTVGTGTVALGFGDFNQDQNTDVVAPASTGDLAYLALGLGNGGLSTPTPYRVGLNPTSVVVDRINGDAFPDVVVVASQPQTLQITLGKGDGTLTTFPNYVLNQKPNMLVAQDVTGDGNVDIVASNPNQASSFFTVLQGAGNGNFTVGTEQAFPASGSVVDMAVADINGDGLPDIIGAIASSPGGMVVVPNQGNGAFGTGAYYATGNPSWGVGVADFDGDGYLDLATGLAGATSFVAVLRGQAGGGFGSAVSYGTGSAAISASELTVQDINADGHPDLIVSFYSTANISALLNQGDGTFATGVVYQPAGASHMGGVAAADFNDDGYGDAASYDDAGNTCLYLGSRSGALTNNVCYSNATERSYDGFAADVNGDGAADLIAAGHSQATFYVYRGQGNGAFDTPDIYVAGNGPIGVVAADFNQDGAMDIAVANSSESTISIHLQTTCP